MMTQRPFLRLLTELRFERLWLAGFTVFMGLSLLWALVPALSYAQGTPSRQSISGRLDYTEDAYRINVGDILAVNVYNQGDLSGGGLLVRSDGSITLNGIGEVPVAGKTVREAALLIENRLADLVREPRVALTVSDSKPPSIYLAGAVMRPGLLQSALSSGARASAGDDGQSAGGGAVSRMDFRLSHILSAAGGVRMNADLANVMISHAGQPSRTVNLWNLLKEGDASEDAILQNGDSVYVPELPEQALDDATYRLLLSSSVGPRAFPVRVIGDVKQPGVYELTATSPFLDSALAHGGGFNTTANRKVVAIRRFSGETKFSTLFVNPNQSDFMLRPNDVVYVSELKIYRSGQFMENVARVFSPFNSISSSIFSFALLRNAF